MDVGKLKRKLRQLKKVEDKIRFEYVGEGFSKKYVWDEYFSTKSIDDMTVKYPISELLNLHKQELKEVFEEYFYSVYFQKYKDIGLDFDEIQDPSVLDYFGLSPGASVDDIKKKFRELAKRYHPDHGGNSEKMNDVKLISPSKEYEKEAYEYIQEFLEYNSEINGTGGLDRYDGYDEWLIKVGFGFTKYPRRKSTCKYLLFC